MGHALYMPRHRGVCAASPRGMSRVNAALRRVIFALTRGLLCICRVNAALLYVSRQRGTTLCIVSTLCHFTNIDVSIQKNGAPSFSNESRVAFRRIVRPTWSEGKDTTCSRLQCTNTRR